MKVRYLLPVLFIAGVMLIASRAHAKEGTAWLYPTFSIIEEFDDNIFLNKDDKNQDLITHLVPGIAFEPKLNQHKLKINYKAEYQFFKEYTKQDGVSHLGQLNSTLNFTDWKIDTNDSFIKSKDRSGSEITARVPRTFNSFDTKVTRMFNKIDIATKYVYRKELYTSDEAIGAYHGHSLTYRDLDTNDHSGELELAAKLWPKTSLLFSTRAGSLNYMTGNKSDSKYNDVLIGLKGKLTAKTIAEGKVGYRRQNYEDYDDDYSGTIFLGNMLHSFNERDTYQFSFERTTNPTNYTSNAYYISTFLFNEYIHGFTKRFRGKANFSYQLNEYPTETTEGTLTDKRHDQIFTTGLGLSYELVRWGTINLDYTHARKISSFDIFDYADNKVKLGMIIDF